jgi:predicted HTH transcriptional regulator
MAKKTIAIIEVKSYTTMKFEYKESSNGYLVTISYATQKTTQETKRVSTKERIILELQKDASLTRDDLAKLLGVSSSAIKQHLSKLKHEKRIARVGSTKPGHWMVLDSREQV